VKICNCLVRSDGRAKAVDVKQWGMINLIGLKRVINKVMFVPFFDRNGSNSNSQSENGMIHINAVMMSTMNYLRSCGQCNLQMRKEGRRTL